MTRSCIRQPSRGRFVNYYYYSYYYYYSIHGDLAAPCVTLESFETFN